MSTWLAGLAASMLAAALGTAGLASVTVLPTWLILSIAFVAVVLVPVATSISQWPEDEVGNDDSSVD